MKLDTGKQLMAEIVKFLYENNINRADIARSKGVTKQAISSFFRQENPRINSVLEILDNSGAELHIEIIKKE